MSLVARPPRDVHVVIKVDTSRFDAAVRHAIDAIDQFGRTWNALPLRTRHAIWAVQRGNRARSRAVTRRKQRRSW